MMVLLLIRMLLRVLLLPQFCSWVLVSSILDLGAATASRMLESIDRVFIQPALDSLLWLADWIDWCIEPALIVFHTWKEIVSVLLDFATRPVRFGLLLWADCVDLCLQPFLYVVYLFVSLARSTFKALGSPFKGLLPSEVGKILPAQALEQLPGYGILQKFGAEGEEGLGTMTSMVTAGPKKVAKMGVSKMEPSNQHKRVEDYTASIISALCHALRALSEVPQSPVAPIGEMMAFGAYDAAEAKFSELTSKLPPVVKSIFFPVLACYAVLLCSGLLFSLLRFAAYGLH